VSGVLRAELTRLRVRRFTWLVLVVVAVLSSSVAVYAWREARVPTAADVRAAHELYEQDLAEWRAEGLARCEELSRKAVAAGLADLECAEHGPDEHFYLSPVPTFHAEGRSSLGALAAPVVVGALLLGASLVTAEFGAGSMGLWLTFVAPRSRAFAWKILAGGVGGAVTGLVGGVVGAGGTLLAFALLHRPLGTGLTALGAVADVTGRLVVLGTLAAVVGAGLGFALRHVAAVMGVALWWVLSVEVVAPLAWARARPLTLAFNVRAWVEGRATYSLVEWVPDAAKKGGGALADVEHAVGALQGGLALAVVATVVTAVGLVVFRVRDVS